MNTINVLLLWGGGGTEHEVSGVSVKHIESSLAKSKEFKIHLVEISKQGEWLYLNEPGFITSIKEFKSKNYTFKIDVAIPCIHGYPGETGELPALFELFKIPFIGCNAEASINAFNKITTKLWFDALNIPNTPFIFLADLSRESINKCVEFFKLHKNVFVKASNQGSSVGVYPASSEEELLEKLKLAFKYSPFVLVEKGLNARELEVSVYEYDNEVRVSYPGEIICPSKFYSYDEKYSNDSKTYTEIRAKNLNDDTVKKIQEYAKKAFLSLKLRHLSRIDFFLENDQIYLNEINTFPGQTPISMFPKMLEANGHSFDKFLTQAIYNSLK